VAGDGASVDSERKADAPRQLRNRPKGATPTGTSPPAAEQAKHEPAKAATSGGSVGERQVKAKVVGAATDPQSMLPDKVTLMPAPSPASEKKP
jgi:hypothetical protein